MDSCQVELTEQDIEVAELVSIGLTNKEIAERINKSPFTIRDRIEKLMQKCQVANRTALAVYLVLKEKVKVSASELQSAPLKIAMVTAIGISLAAQTPNLTDDPRSIAEDMRTAGRAPMSRPVRREIIV